VWFLPAPDYFWSVPEAERESRVVLTKDQCIIDDRYFFVAGNFSIPVAGTEDAVKFTCWVSLSNQAFERMNDTWENPERVKEEPYCGWFSNNLPTYTGTVKLKARLHQQPPGTKPVIELEPTDHPLSVDSRIGITPERAAEIRQRMDSIGR